MTTKTSIFIFRRDFRLTDNVGFLKCYKESTSVLPIFIFTPEQTRNNEYFSNHCFQFMIESLFELDELLYSKYKTHLHFFYGDNITILRKIKKEIDYQSIYYNMDYTPYALERDKEIQEFCENEGVECITTEDYLLYPMGTIMKKDRTFYQKYTPFKNAGLKFTPNQVQKAVLRATKFMKQKHFDFEFSKEEIEGLYHSNPHLLEKGGRSHALKILKNPSYFNQYKEMRNSLTYQTTHLSAYIKFGCISIREVYWAFHRNHTIIDQLLWREFYYYLIYYIPEILKRGVAQHEKFNHIEWRNNRNWFEKWKEGRTGFPVVDAGIREMNETGYMHNRARLIVASVLIKILQIDWKWGEKYFAQMLVDYDPSVNNGNWQWCAGVGENPQDYWRFFSPWKQAIDYDPDCEYIKRWIPELREIPNEIIHHWDMEHQEWKDKTEYPKPLTVFDAELRESTLEMYRKSF